MLGIPNGAKGDGVAMNKKANPSSEKEPSILELGGSQILTLPIVLARLGLSAEAGRRLLADNEGRFRDVVGAFNNAVLGILTPAEEASVTTFVGDMTPVSWQNHNGAISCTRVVDSLRDSRRRPTTGPEILKWAKACWDGRSEVVTFESFETDHLYRFHVLVLEGDRVNPRLKLDLVPCDTTWPKYRWVLVVDK